MGGRTKTLRRWGDNDRHFGLFTYARDKRYRPFALVLSSAEEEYPGCCLRLSALGHTLILELPSVVTPHRSWVDTSQHGWSRPPHGYWQIDPRNFGFTCSDGFLQVYRGRTTGDSSTDRTWGTFLPWMQLRHVRHSFYGLQGEHVATLPNTGKSYLGDPDRWQRERDIANTAPTAAFEFDDFDGERIIATTRIEEREWRAGTGWFKWLALFRKPKIGRSLHIEFSAETGRRKGTWKGAQSDTASILTHPNSTSLHSVATAPNMR